MTQELTNLERAFQVSMRSKRPRPLTLQPKPAPFSQPTPCEPTVQHPDIVPPQPTLDLSRLPPPKKLKPSREHETALKSAIRSPLISPSGLSSPDYSIEGGMSDLFLVEPSTSNTSSPAQTRKYVRFTASDEEMLTVYITHSSQAYDRSPISVDRSLRLPPRSREPEEEEEEPEEETSPKPHSTLTLSSGFSDWDAFMASSGSGSALDGF